MYCHESGQVLMKFVCAVYNMPNSSEGAGVHLIRCRDTKGIKKKFKKPLTHIEFSKIAFT